MVLDGKDLANNKCEHLGLKLQKMKFRDENNNWQKLIGCNLDFSLQYLYSRDEIEAGILWKMEICFIVDSELVFFIFVVYGLLMHVLGTIGALGDLIVLVILSLGNNLQEEKNFLELRLY